MTAYTLAPVLDGPALWDSMTRAELARRLAAQAEELARVRKQLVVAQAAARHMEELRLRMDNESALRVRAQQRLWRVGMALATISNLCPEADAAVAVAREEIWRQGDA